MKKKNPKWNIEIYKVDLKTGQKSKLRRTKAQRRKFIALFFGINLESDVR